MSAEHRLPPELSPMQRPNEAEAEEFFHRQRIEYGSLRVLTLHQPWASLMAWGLKLFETRPFSTKYRGQLLIHAAKFDCLDYWRLYDSPYFKMAARVIGLHGNLPRGCILGVVTLVDVHPASMVAHQIGPSERAFGLYEPGRYAWQTDPQCTRRFKDPIAAKGMQGMPRLSNQSDEVISLVADAMEAQL